VAALLQNHHRGLTFHDIKERLALDQRESRNLGPVLNQMAKTGKIIGSGRGMPWLLPASMPLQLSNPKPDQADHRDWNKAKDFLVKGVAVTFENTDQPLANQPAAPAYKPDYSDVAN
jgi:hypothetical protein